MIIAFRCWGGKFTYVILRGDQNDPEIVDSKHLKIPPGFSRPEELEWFRKEVHEVLTKFSITSGLFKAIEPISRTKDMSRGEMEGVLQLSALMHPKKILLIRRIKSQLNKHTASRKAKYLDELLDNEALSSLNTANFREASICALSGLNK